MHYCCKGIGKCCSSCCKCLDDCCGSCGKCWGECCASCSKIFDRPFSSCALIQFIMMFCPFVICWAVGFSNLTSSCSNPVQVHVIVQGFNLFLNFLIIFYLMYKYSSPQPSLEGKSYSQKLIHLLCYDVVICLYTFFLAFEFAWNIVGHVWLNGSDCDESLLESIDYLGIIVNWVFLGFIVLYLLFVALLGCCDSDCDGSCCFGCLACFYYLCCCCCCFGKFKHLDKESKENRERKRAERERGAAQANRNSSRVNGWMQRFLRISNAFSGDNGQADNRRGNNAANPPQNNPGHAAGHQPANPLQAYPQQAYPQQAYPQQAYPQQAYPQQAYPQQAYPQQPYPNQGYPQPGYNYHQQPGHYP